MAGDPDQPADPAAFMALMMRDVPGCRSWPAGDGLLCPSALITASCPGTAAAHPGAAAFTELIGLIQLCLGAGAQTRRPGPFLAFQLWSLPHGMTDLRASKPELPWPGTGEMIDHFHVSLGLRTPRRDPGAP